MSLYTLITNDDGVSFPSITELHAEFCNIGSSIIIAPNTDCTGVAQAITLFNNIDIIKYSDIKYGVHGYPVDCVGIALHSPLLEKNNFDMVISGINKGVNMGSDIWYSGTLGAARHAYIHGCKAIAFSCGYIDPKSPFSPIAIFARKFATFAFNTIQEPFLLNVNYPIHTPIKGIRWSTLGKRIYKDDYKIIHSTEKLRTISFNGSFLGNEDIPGSDFNNYNDGYISVTPLALNAIDQINYPKWSTINLEDSL